MSDKPSQIDTNHQEKRKLLRTAGIIILIIGIALLIIGMVDFFSAASTPFGGGPKIFWVNFIALPLIFVGVSMTSMGYMGAVARYSAEEMAPVGKDTFNYMAKGTTEGVEAISRAIKTGMDRHDEEEKLICPNCSKENPQGSGFCNSCGAPLEKKKACSRCGFDNPSEAKFCNGCGSKLD